MKKIFSRAALVIMMLSSICMPATALAASNSLGVNPRKDFTIKAGETKTDKIFVRNLSSTDDLNISINLLDFQSQGQTGAPALLLKQTQPTAWSLKPYMTIQKSASIGAGKSTEIPFTITIPTNVGAGSYYSAVRFSADNGGGKSNLQLSGSSISLIFARVPGQAKDSLQMTQFGAFTPSSDLSTGVYGSFYSATAPRYLAYELKNAGNVAEQPSGSILLKDIFGKQVKLYQNANPNNNLVLIGQTRRFDFCLNPQTVAKTVNGVKTDVEKCNDFGFKPGHYTALLDSFYGNNGSSSREITATASFWYLPAWFIITCLVVLLLVVGVIWLIVNAIRAKRNRRYKTR